VWRIGAPMSIIVTDERSGAEVPARLALGTRVRVRLLSQMPQAGTCARYVLAPDARAANAPATVAEQAVSTEIQRDLSRQR
jgi:hypothetical protein